MPSWLLTSDFSSLVCQPNATAACMLWCAAKPGIPSVQRVYPVMKVYGLLLQRYDEHHDDGVAVDQRNIRWCSDGLEISCYNGEKVRAISRSTAATVRPRGM